LNKNYSFFFLKKTKEMCADNERAAQAWAKAIQEAVRFCKCAWDREREEKRRARQ